VDGAIADPHRANHLWVRRRDQTYVSARDDVGVAHAEGTAVNLWLERENVYVIKSVNRDPQYSSAPATSPSGVPVHLHDSRYFTEAEHIATSAGAGDAGKPIVLDAAGHVDATMVNDADMGAPLDTDKLAAVRGGALGTLLWSALKTALNALYLLVGGKAGGQTAYGGTASGENLTLGSTAHATKGKILFGSDSAYDEANDRWGFGTQAPAAAVHVAESGNFTVRLDSDTGITDIEMRSGRTSAFTHNRFVGAAASGGLSAPAQLPTGTQIFALAGKGYTSAGAFGITNNFFEYASQENFTATAQGTILDLYTVKAGETVRASRLGLRDWGANLVGYLQWSGQKRTTSDVNKTNSTLATITGLSVNVEAGRAYYFRAVLFVDPHVTGGHKYAVGGTCTATSIKYYIRSIEDATGLNVISSRQVALGGAAGQAGATAVLTEIFGTIVVNAGGTLLLQFAQDATNASASTVLTDSFFEVQQLA
jgi:hypothetical protein